MQLEGEVCSVIFNRTYEGRVRIVMPNGNTK